MTLDIRNDDGTLKECITVACDDMVKAIRKWQSMPHTATALAKCKDQATLTTLSRMFDLEREIVRINEELVIQLAASKSVPIGELAKRAKTSNTRINSMVSNRAQKGQIDYRNVSRAQIGNQIRRKLFIGISDEQICTALKSLIEYGFSTKSLAEALYGYDADASYINYWKTRIELKAKVKNVVWSKRVSQDYESNNDDDKEFLVAVRTSLMTGNAFQEPDLDVMRRLKFRYTSPKDCLQSIAKRDDHPPYSLSKYAPSHKDDTEKLHASILDVADVMENNDLKNITVSEYKRLHVPGKNMSYATMKSNMLYTSWADINKAAQSLL